MSYTTCFDGRVPCEPGLASPALALFLHSFQTDNGHVQNANYFSAGGSEVSDYSLDGKQQKQQSSKNRHYVVD